MQNDNTSTFIEKLKHQLTEEQRRYRSALNSNKEFWELKLIKNNIKKLQASLERFMQTIRGYMPKKNGDLR